MYRPPYIVLDYETEASGEASTEFYRPDFYVSSAAFAWKKEDGSIGVHYIDGICAEPRIHAYLEEIIKTQIPVVVHNFQFEYGVTLCRFPGLAERLIWHADTMRLVQVFDNGGGEYEFLPMTYDEQLDHYLAELDKAGENEEKKPKKVKKYKAVYIGGLSLKNAAMRLLKIEDPKKKAHEWLRENVEGCKKGNEGSFLPRLPPELMREYNIGDVETELKLYEHCVQRFAKLNYDWHFDHGLYMSTCRHIVLARIAGIQVDREALAAYASTVRTEIETIASEFASRFAEPIGSVERSLLIARLNKLKTLRGRKNFLRRYRVADEGISKNKIQFNVGSNRHLAKLFVDQLHMDVRFKTATGLAAFRSAVLDSYGEGGALLKTRRKRLLVLKQCEALLALSQYDGLWHSDLRVAGTSTGRGAGGASA